MFVSRCFFKWWWHRRTANMCFCWSGKKWIFIRFWDGSFDWTILGAAFLGKNLGIAPEQSPNNLFWLAKGSGSAWPPFLPAASRENLGRPFTPSTLGPVPGSHDICTPCRFTERTPSFQILWLLQAKSLAWCTIQPATSAKAPPHAPSSGAATMRARHTAGPLLLSPSTFHPLPAEAKVRPAQDCRAVIIFL